VPKSPQLHIFARLSDPAFLAQAWRRVREHYPAAKLPAELVSFERRRGANLDALAAQIANQTFLPQPAFLIDIPKPNKPGETRPIALLQPEDRIVLTALNTLLYPRADRTLLPGCIAYRAGQGPSIAIQRLRELIAQGNCFSATGDIDNFFASINRDHLFKILSRQIQETPILNLLEAYLHIGTSARNLEWSDTGLGIAQGSPLSPLLSNLYLSDFDRHLQSSNLPWMRYADNLILLANDAARLQTAWERAVRYLASPCQLKLNADSVSLVPVSQGFEFLGVWLQTHGGKLVTTMAPSRLEQKRLALTALLRGNSLNLEQLVVDIAESSLGWRNYYGKVQGTGPQLLSLEEHLTALLIPWLQHFRANAGRRQTAAELKAALMKLELPVTTDPRGKIKWIELLLARSKPPSVATTNKASLSVLAAKAIRSRKEEMEQRRQELEEIIITKPGTYLGRSGERLVIRRDGKRQNEVPFNLIRNITFLTTAISLSGELIVETAARGIPILVAGPDGRPAVRIGPPDLPSYDLSLAQSTLAASPGGLELARIIVNGKIRNQRNLLQYLLKFPERRSGSKDFLSIGTTAIADMRKIMAENQKLSFREAMLPEEHDRERNRLFASEAQAALSYWSAVRALLWWKPGFERRVHRGAGDLVNSLLNYGYGILYSRLLTVLLKSGLNANIGFLHKPQPGKAGLLYDFIEEFRAPVVDRTVFALLNLSVDLTVSESGLDSESRHILARRVLERFQANTRYHGEAIPLQKVVELQAQMLIRHIRGEEAYKPYVLPW
jgi:CRISPR-associated endonuclease Cas1